MHALRLKVKVVVSGTSFLVLALCLSLLTVTGSVHGHGRLLEPPNRSSVWRFPEFQNLNPPTNYNDNELNCGGFTNQHYNNAGKCGICGDPYEAQRPRANEDGGRFGRGILVRKYQRGQDIDVLVNLSANHRGYFEFRICAQDDSPAGEVQACFDQNLLQVISETGQVGMGQNMRFTLQELISP